MSEERFIAIRASMMPRDTNLFGNIFGGHILSLIDLSALHHARKVALHRYVTKIMREVNFIAPVYVGDLVTFYTSTVKIGCTSVTVKVEVEANRGVEEIQTVRVTEAEVVMVAVDSEGKPTPLN
jgi:acyl-CoA thioesterase YciA